MDGFSLMIAAMWSLLKLEELKPLVSIQSSAITNHYFELGYLKL